jgi:hypothetical protein
MAVITDGRVAVDGRHNRWWLWRMRMAVITNGHGRHNGWPLKTHGQKFVGETQATRIYFICTAAARFLVSENRSLPRAAFPKGV